MKRKEQKFRGTQCLNCETPLDVSEKYCHACGQLNSTKKLTISDFIEEFFSNFYAYDSRLRNSIVSIFTKPGVLAREFNQGKRHTYANPFRLFLSVSIVLFISFNLTVGKSESVDNQEKKLSEKEIIEGNKKDSILLTKINDKFNLDMEYSPSKVNKFVYYPDSIYTKKIIYENTNNSLQKLKYKITSFRNYKLKYPEKSKIEVLKNLGYENNRINNFIYNKSIQLESNEIEKEIGTYFYEKLPLLIFLSLPILTLMFSMVFYSKNINYTEHLVFTYTFFTFIFLCMIIFNIIGIISDSAAAILALISFTLLFPLYFYKSLRNFYQQNRWKTVLKFVLLNPLFFLFLSVCTITMLFLGILLF